MNKKQRIVAIVLVVLVIAMFVFSILKQADRNMERFVASKNFTPSDFVEKEYEITGVWTRKFERTTAPDEQYIFFKVKGEKFNFNLGRQFSDYGNNSNNTKAILPYLTAGEKVKILANKKDIEYASDQSLLRKAERFFSGTNDEVEVYSLILNDREIVHQDINQPSSSNSNFANIAIEHNLLKLMLVCGGVYGIIFWTFKLINRRNRKEKLN